MIIPSRRGFLGASLAAFTGAHVLGQDPSPTVPATGVEDVPFQPNTLFLTWQRDPTTTMTIQWIGTMGETADTRICYTAESPAAHMAGPGRPTPRPYPMTDFKVFRAELTGLTPGTDYWFRIGK